LPNSDHGRLLRITYRDREGVLRDILGLASRKGLANTIVDSRKFEADDGERMVRIDVKFEGKSTLHLLVAPPMDVTGGDTVSMREDRVHSVDDDGDSV